jgi:hypothetical protein
MPINKTAGALNASNPTRDPRELADAKGVEFYAHEI